VQRITKDQGVTHILEVSGAGTFQQSLDSVARGGVISIIAFMTTVPQDQIPDVAMSILAHGCVVRGVQGGSKQQLEEAARFVGSREIRMPVEKIFEFTQESIINGLKYVASEKHVGKICINVP
jgi:NADPH:quinone reductase-like Zn-dependent oxidoreductase